MKAIINNAKSFIVEKKYNPHIYNVIVKVFIWLIELIVIVNVQHQVAEHYPLTDLTLSMKLKFLYEFSVMMESHFTIWQGKIEISHMLWYHFNVF